jgi:hypothetical protein
VDGVVSVGPARLLFIIAHGRPLHRSNWPAIWRAAVGHAGLPLDGTRMLVDAAHLSNRCRGPNQ